MRLLPIFVASLIGVCLYVLSARTPEPYGWRRARTQLAAELGGRVLDGGAAVLCVIDGVEVTLRPVQDGRYRGVRASVVCPSRGVVRGGLLPDWVFGQSAPVTGDDAFDRRVALQGPELEAVAPLDAAARAIILRGVAADVVFERGAASVRIPWWGGPAGPVLGPLRLLVDASRPWRVADVGLRSCLCALVEGDPERMVRSWALLRLSRLPGDAAELAHHLATQGGLAVMDALASPHADEVTGAAVWLGARGGVDAVPALRGAQVRSLAEPASIAVADAILAIQARVAPDAVGSLARVEDDGALSVARVDELAVVRGDGATGQGP